ERVEVRRDRAVAEVLGVLVLELGDHRSEVGGAVGEGAAIDRLVARLLDELGEDRPERVAVGVVRVHAGDLLVRGRDAVPHGHEAALELLQAEEEQRDVLVRLGWVGRVAAQAGVPGLPWADGRDAGHTLRLRHDRDRVCRLGSGGGQQHVHVVVEYELARDLRGTVGIRLAVGNDDVDFVISTIRATPAYSKGFKIGSKTYQGDNTA